MTNNGERIELDCGIAYERIRAWLDDELVLEKAGNAWVFSVDDGRCFVEISPLAPRTYGRITLERTSLVVTGDERAVAPFRKLFTLRFISAGG